MIQGEEFPPIYPAEPDPNKESTTFILDFGQHFEPFLDQSFDNISIHEIRCNDLIISTASEYIERYAFGFLNRGENIRLPEKVNLRVMRLVINAFYRPVTVNYADLYEIFRILELMLFRDVFKEKLDKSLGNQVHNILKDFRRQYHEYINDPNIKDERVSTSPERSEEESIVWKPDIDILYLARCADDFGYKDLFIWCIMRMKIGYIDDYLSSNLTKNILLFYLYLDWYYDISDVINIKKRYVYYPRNIDHDEEFAILKPLIEWIKEAPEDYISPSGRIRFGDYSEYEYYDITSQSMSAIMLKILDYGNRGEYLDFSLHIPIGDVAMQYKFEDSKRRGDILRGLILTLDEKFFQLLDKTDPEISSDIRELTGEEIVVIN